MKADAWMPLYIADYLRDTMRLTTVQHGAYFLLLMACWADGGSLPDDDAELAAIVKLGPDEWSKCRRTIERFFAVVDGRWTHKRVAAELEKARRLSEIRREQGSKGGRPKKLSESKEKPNGLANANQNGLQNETPALVARPSPLPLPSEDIEAKASLSSVDDAQAPPKYPEPFETAWKAYPHVKGRSSKSKAFAVWRRLSQPIRQALPSAVARYAREGREPRSECGAKAFERWLGDERYSDWIVEAQPPAGPVDAAIHAKRVQHYRDTGEWKPSWPNKPNLESAA